MRTLSLSHYLKKISMNVHQHESVLLQESLEALCLRSDDTVVDATLGGAGHFKEILARVGHDGVVVGIDADPDAVARAVEAARNSSAQVHVVHENFRNLHHILDTLGIQSITKALFDLGWSSFHLSSGRGFSFMADEPLSMTYDAPEKSKTAAHLLNIASEEAIADMIFALGEERFARPIAHALCQMREEKKIETTQDVVDAVLAATPLWYQRRRIHPATKTFQALRIAVNDELGALREGLSAALSRLEEGGRVAIISFHSIEDRIVKLMLRDAAHQGQGTIVTKKPIVPSQGEAHRNPRSRSAKLRVFEKGRIAQPVNSHTSIYSYA